MRPFILLHGKLHMRPCIVRHATLHMRLSNARDCVRFLSTTPLFISVPRSNLSTFVNQDKLKRLPIPSLTETLSKYLNSLRPIVSSEAHLKSTRIAGDFLSKGVGEKLQNKLIAYGKTQKHSWLEELWYKKAYLEWQEPLLINSNWWLQLKDSIQVTSLLTHAPKLSVGGCVSKVQLDRAAGMISNLLDFKQNLENETMPPDTMGKFKTPLCMNQYRMMFGVNRLPGLHCDHIRQEFPCTSKHVMVMVNDQMFFVPVLGPSGERVSLRELRRQLDAVIVSVGQLGSVPTPPQPSVNLLTSERRDVWSKLRQHLVQLSPKNAVTLDEIESSLFSICLDTSPAPSDPKCFHKSVFFGQEGAGNRWFDKALSFVIVNNGRAGCNGEHSPSDAVIPGVLMDYLVRNEPCQDPPTSQPLTLPSPKHLGWIVDDVVMEAIDSAKLRGALLFSSHYKHATRVFMHSVNDFTKINDVAERDIEDTENELLHFNDFGSESIRRRLNVSPDAFIQLVLQLAYFRLHSASCATYESASTRQFLHGRTETIRSCSVESAAFTREFEGKSELLSGNLSSLFLAAIDAHVRYSRDATNGKGVDRHLLGLRAMQDKGNEMAELFTDPSFLKSMQFKLSTSNVSPGDLFYGGFGPVMADGYGVNYAISKENLKFSISSKVHAPFTSSYKFRQAIQSSLLDMMDKLSSK